MNDVQEKIPIRDPYDEKVIRERIRRRKEAEKRRRKRQKQILLSCAITVIICVVAIVALLLTGKDSSTGNLTAGSVEEEKSVYEKIEYCNTDYLERYEAYADLNPDMAVADIVWRVNANLDKPKYEYDIPVSGYDIDMIVNKYYKVPEDYKPDDLELFENYYLRKEAGEAYEKMRDAAAEENLKIYITSAYRSVEYQRGLYNRYLGRDPQEAVDRYSARPGHSEHHLGLAIDIAAPGGSQRQFVNTPEYEWVKENCHKYGFIIRYLEETEEITGYEFEPWHLRYVGAEISNDMKNKNINNFEEYHAKYLE